MAAIRPVVLIFRIESQLELLANFDGLVAKDRLEPPIPKCLARFAVADSCCDFVGFFHTIVAWPLIDRFGIAPVGSD